MTRLELFAFTVLVVLAFIVGAMVGVVGSSEPVKPSEPIKVDVNIKLPMPPGYDDGPQRMPMPQERRISPLS